MSVSAKVIADSSFQGNRLITVEIELHRFVLPEFNTHRSISRNFQSSRAVPVKQMIEQVRNNPAMPVHWGLNEPGMVAEKEVEGFTKQQSIARWIWAAEQAAECAESLNAAGVHKQVVNRILEPFMWTRGVATATMDDWKAFLKLRLHKDAQPEIKALAYEIGQAILNSKTEEKKSGEWHVPYVETTRDFDGNIMYVGESTKDDPLAVPDVDTDRYMRVYTFEDAVAISSSCCGQVSYRKLDDSLEKAKKIYGMLNLPCEGVYPDNPPHFSPTEHQVKFEYGSCKSLSGNFHKQGFIQYRKALEMGIEKELI